MKLIYLANIRLPTERAHGIQIMKMCEAFGAEGNDVLLMVPNKKNAITADPFGYYEVKRNFKIKKIPFFEFNVFNIEILNFFLQSIFFIISAKISLFSEKYDVLYARDAFYGIFFKNVVLEIHSITNRINYFYIKSLKSADRIIVLTSFIKDKLAQISIRKDKILISPDAVDIKKFAIGLAKEEARKRLGLPVDKNIILYTGHLYGWKGADTLAESASSFDDKTFFVFVGGIGTYLDSFKDKYSSFKNIKIIGQKPHSEIPLYLSSADVLILPNSAKEDISRLYTSPMKLFEYMASGRPIIASNLPSIREILNEDNAVFFEPDSSESLVMSIRKVLEDKNIRDKISQRASRDVLRYTWETRAKNIITFLK